MNRTTLTKILSNSTFADTTIPYRTFVDEDKRLIAVANSFSTQWSGRNISIWSTSILLYDLDTLELKNFVDNLDYPVNDLSFHPKEKNIALGIGRYDGGAYYEGELLLWNYETNELNSILADNREVIKCSFSPNGDKLSFTLNPTDDLDCPDYTDKQYDLDFPILTKIKLDNLSPVLVNDHIDNFNIEDYNNRLSNADRVLTDISNQKKQVYKNRNLIWDIVFISKNEIALARNNATVEIWNIDTGTVREIKLFNNGDCVELFFNSSNNSLLVNLWSRDFQSENTNELFSIDLSNLEFQEVINCSHIISKSKNNYFLARQVDHSEKTKKDFILNPSYKVVFEKRIGHYDLFNHYLRIDNSELLYYLVGNPKEQYQNKTLCSINPGTFEIKEVWQLEKQPNHFNDLNGIKINDYIIISGKVYSSNRNPYDTQELFCIDLVTKKEKWLKTVGSQVCSFAILDNNSTLVLALTNGQIELIESENGKTIEVINRSKNQSFARPLSLATFDNKIAVGLTNGQIEIYER
ncbi:hypothetical protein FVR03_10220 [Pontibacter qinzhouensis]|uniref:WD40 repeat domain-containing protein n=1 Tax=Pontibacter qinzhouensis TaxID=2603253 RepID=A0A5C8K8G6_9BACT|nr:hypothetical protein [Pontibacter qinzhouensis]TXK46795.1 hypothetical protein FVR03_10220 [Pontibacter qinzhouensis]